MIAVDSWFMMAGGMLVCTCVILQSATVKLWWLMSGIVRSPGHKKNRDIYFWTVAGRGKFAKQKSTRCRWFTPAEMVMFRVPQRLTHSHHPNEPSQTCEMNEDHAQQTCLFKHTKSTKDSARLPTDLPKVQQFWHVKSRLGKLWTDHIRVPKSGPNVLFALLENGGKKTGKVIADPPANRPATFGGEPPAIYQFLRKI